MDTGPSIRGVCRILNQNSCGSGSICGIQPSGNALILTNAHVAGTKIGRIGLPERCANVCFGGTKRNWLFMAASHSVYALYVNTQGVKGG